MDKSNSIIISSERKRGQHLGAEESGAIQQLKKLGYSHRAIARELNCSPSTVGYELKRGTPEYSGRGRRPGYSAKPGASVYTANRSRCRRRKTIPRNAGFLRWMAEKIRNHGWSIDTCVGRSKRIKAFEAEKIPCTKTVYNMIWQGELEITLFDLPEVLSRRQRRKPRVPKRSDGKIIDLRPAEVKERNTFGHWESDTVVGRKNKGEPAAFTIVERLTGHYLSFKINGKTADGVAGAMQQLHEMFGDQFSKVFKTITTDNGSEFANFSDFEALGTEVYFAHHYSSWERPVNERTNRLLRKFMPKGVSMNSFSEEDILVFSDELNAMPRRRLGYRTPEELFEQQLDLIYQA